MEADATGPAKVQTDGINFTGVWAHTDLIDVDNITTNDVGTTLRIYGVEAARATLMREVRAVFGAYGIGVDPRHLSLIADFMTHMVRLQTLLDGMSCKAIQKRWRLDFSLRLWLAWLDLPCRTPG